MVLPFPFLSFLPPFFRTFQSFHFLPRCHSPSGFWSPGRKTFSPLLLTHHLNPKLGALSPTWFSLPGFLLHSFFFVSSVCFLPSAFCLIFSLVSAECFLPQRLWLGPVTPSIALLLLSPIFRFVSSECFLPEQS